MLSSLQDDDYVRALIRQRDEILLFLKVRTKVVDSQILFEELSLALLVHRQQELED